MTEAKQALDLHQVLPGSNLRLVQNAGHMVIYADVAAVANAVRSAANGAGLLARS